MLAYHLRRCRLGAGRPVPYRPIPDGRRPGPIDGGGGPRHWMLLEDDSARSAFVSDMEPFSATMRATPQTNLRVPTVHAFFSLFAHAVP